MAYYVDPSTGLLINTGEDEGSTNNWENLNGAVWNQPQQSPYAWNQTYNNDPYNPQVYNAGNQALDWNSIFGAVGQAMNAAANYAQPAPTFSENPETPFSFQDYQTPAYQQPQPQQDPFTMPPSVDETPNFYEQYQPPKTDPFSTPADFYQEESQANTSDGTVSDFETVESGAKPKNYSQPDPFSLDFNPENPGESYADYYRNYDPRGIVEGYQEAANKPTLPEGTGSGGGTFGGSNDFSGAGSVSAFDTVESQNAAQDKASPGIVVDPFNIQVRRTVLPYQEGYDPQTGGVANPAELFGPIQDNSAYANSVNQAAAAPWQEPTKQGMNPFEFVGDVTNKVVSSGLGALGAAVQPFGQTANDLANSNIPVVSQGAQLVRGAYENAVEPVLGLGSSVAGTFLKAGDEALAGVFNRDEQTKLLTQKKVELEQEIYDKAIAAGYSDAQASAYAQQLEPITSYNQLINYPIQLPKALENIPREVFDRDNLTQEYTAKKQQYVQDAYDQVVAGGGTPDQASQVAQNLDRKLGNFANLSEYEDLQKFGTLPALVQFGVMIGDPIANTGANLAAKAAFATVGKAAGEAADAAGLSRLGKVIESPQQAGYAATEAVRQLVPALQDYSNVSGIPFADLAQEFATNPGLRENLGYTASKETSQLASAIGQKLDDTYKSLPANPVPTFDEIVAANKEAYTEFRFQQNINGRFADEATALADAEARADRLFNTVKNQGKLNQVQKSFPGMDVRANEILAENDATLMQQKFQQAVSPASLADETNQALQLQTKATKVDKATGKIVPTRPLEQLGPVAGTVLRGPGPATTSFLARLWLNSPGRLIRDPMTNIVKSVMEGVNPFGSKKITAAVDEIGLTRPEFSEGLSGDTGKKFMDNKAGKAVFTALNPQGELTGAALNKLSKLKVKGKTNPLNLGSDVNSTVGAWEQSVKKNVWEARAFESFNNEAAKTSRDLAKKYNLDRKTIDPLLRNGKLTEKDLKDFSKSNLPTGQAKQFVKEVAAARADLRIQAGNFGTKEMDRMFFSYKKNVLESVLSSYAPFSYWGTRNLQWLAGYLSHNPFKIAALSNFLDQNYQANQKAGVPEYARNQIMLGQGSNGEQKLWNWANSLPFAMPNDILTNQFTTVASGDRDYSAPAKKQDLGAFLFGSEGNNGARNMGLIPTMYQLNPALNFFTQEGLVSDALRELHLTTDNLGSPGPRNKQTLGLIPGASIYRSAAAALGWPIQELRKSGILPGDFDPEGPLNELLFGTNAGKPLTRAQEEIAVMVQNGQLTDKEGKEALLSIKTGKWNAAALKALDKVEGEDLPAKLLSFMGLPTTTVNAPRDQFNEEIRREYAAVKNDKGRYVDVVKTDPATGRTYTTKEFQPGKVQEFFDKNPGTEILFSASDSAEELQQSLKDDVTRQAISDLAKKRDDKSITMQDYYSQLDQLQAANPEYFKAQTQTKLDKISGKKPLLPGEDMPEVLTPQQDKSKRDYNITTDQYKRLNPGFDDLQAKAYDLKDKGDQAGYEKIVNSQEYRAAVKKQTAFIQDNPDWFKQYQQNLADEGFDTNSLGQRLYNEKLSDFKNVAPGFTALQDKANAAYDKGDMTGYYKILNSAEYKDALHKQDDFIKSNPEWYAQYSKQTQENNTERNAEGVGGLAFTNPALAGKPVKTLEDRKFQETSNEYHGLAPGFEEMQQKAYALKDAGDDKGYSAIVGSPEYKTAQKKQNDFIEAHQDWFTQYQKNLAEQGYSTKSLADRRYQEKVDDYYNIGGDAYKNLQAQINAAFDAKDDKKAYALMSNPIYTKARYAQQDYLDANPDFAARFKTEYQAKNGKAMQTRSELQYQDKLNQYSDIGGEAYDFLTQQQQSLRDAGRTKEANAIYASAAYQNVQKARDQYLKDNPDFATAYFAKYPSAKTSFDKRQNGSSTGSTGYTSSYSSSKKPYVPYSTSKKTSYSSYSKSYSSSSSSSAPWTTEQKKAYGAALGAGMSKAEATKIANGLSVGANGKVNNPFLLPTSDPRNPFYIPAGKGGTGAVMSKSNSTFGQSGRTSTAGATSPTSATGGYDQYLLKQGWGVFGQQQASSSAAKAAAAAAGKKNPAYSYVAISIKGQGWYVWAKPRNTLTNTDWNIINRSLGKPTTTTGTSPTSYSSPSGYIPNSNTNPYLL